MKYVAGEIITEVGRTFQFDYIFFDAIFLALWLGIVIKQKKWAPLKVGIITAICIYIIDAVVWWNLPSSVLGVNIREYHFFDLNGIEMPRSTVEFALVKFSADFMMTISYALVAFTWVWIIFESWKARNTKDMLLYTALLFGGWLIIPWLSLWIPVYDAQVSTVRHMDTQMVAQILAVVAGYALMTALYWKKDKRVILYVFCVGCFQAFTMEFPLLISGIRPATLELLLYEVLILANQGAPYLYVIYDKIIPYLGRKRTLIKSN